MIKTFDLRLGDEKITPLLEKLLEGNKAQLVDEARYLKVYSIEDIDIALISRWGTSGYSSGYSYKAIGTQENIALFEKLF